MEYTHCIWDFNGTVLDDIDAGVGAVNALLAQRGLPVLENREAYRRVFGFPVRAYYEKLGFDFSREPYEVVAPLWVAEYQKRVGNSGLFDDVRETIERFRERGIHQILLSATERSMLRGQTDDLGISACFDEILGLNTIHAHSKCELAAQWRRENPQAKVFFLGDTDHDAEAAAAAGADCFLIVGGHQTLEKLKATGTPVFYSRREACDYILKTSEEKEK